jgi:hypothetical protein
MSKLVFHKPCAWWTADRTPTQDSARRVIREAELNQDFAIGICRDGYQANCHDGKRRLQF